MRQYSHIIIILGFTILISACARPKQSYVPPKDYGVKKSMSFDKEYDKVWKETISFLGENSITIDEIDKNSGFIQASYTNSKLEGKIGEYLDCGSKISPKVMINGYIAKFNIIISEDKLTTVTINTFFDIDGEKTYNEYWSGERVSIKCNSTGVFENEIFEFITNN